MGRAKTIAKWGLIGLAGLLAAGAVVVALGLGWLRSDGGRAWLARQIEAAASTPGEMELSIGSLAGDLPAHLSARDIVLRDAEGAWLSIAALDLDWRPWALLSRTVAIDSLSLSRVELARLPAAPAAPEASGAEAGGGGLPALPLKISLSRLAADDIALGAPVLGQAARFSLAGEAGSRDDGGLSARLDLQRLDGPEARLQAQLAYDPATDGLTAEIDAAEAPGGLLATLLEVPDLPRAELRLTGSGPLAAWDGDFTLSLGEVAQAEAAITLARADNGDLGFRLDGAADITPPGESAVWALAEGRTALNLNGAWQDARRLHLESLSARNDQLRLTARGDVEPETGALDLTLNAAADDGAALARLLDVDRLDSLTADIALSGSLDRPEAEIALETGGLASPDVATAGVSLQGRVAAQDDLSGPSPALALDLSGRFDAPRLPGEDAVNRVLGDALPFALQGRLDLDSAVLDIATLEASLDKGRLTGSGPFDLAAGNARLQADLAVEDLTVLQPLTDITLGGRARLAGPLSLEGYGSFLDADLKGRWEQPSSDIALITAAAGGDLDITTHFTLDGGELRIDQATARSATTELQAALTVAGPALRDGRYSLALADAAVLAGELGADFAGPARIEGTLSGPFDALDLAGRVQAARLTLAEQSLSDLSGTYDLRLSGADLDGPVSAALASPFGRAEARAELRVRPDSVTLDSLQAELPKTRVTGVVEVPLDGGAPRAELQGQVADLAPWLALADLSGGGQGQVTVQLNQPGAAAPLTAVAELSQISLRPAAEAAPLDVGRLTLDLTAEAPDLAAPAKLKVGAESLRWQRLALDRLDLDGTGSAEDLDLTLAAAGTWIEPLELRAAGRLLRQDDRLDVTLRTAEGRAFGQPLTLNQAAQLSLAPGETRLEGLDLASGETRLTADARLAGSSVTAAAVLDSLPMTTVDAFWDSGLEGKVSARLDLQGQLEDPRGSASLTARGLRPRDAEDLPALELTSNADWQGGRVKLQGELGGEAVTAARFSAEAPLRMTPEGTLEVPQDGALSGDLTWSGGIDTVFLFVPLPQHRLEGQADVALSLGGTVGAPRLDGNVALAKGRYENLDSGTVLRDLKLTAEVADDRLRLASLTANDGSGGQVTGDGELRIDPAQDFPFDAEIRLDKFHALRRDDVEAVASGRVRLEGSMAAPRIEGRFTTETVEVSLLTELPPDVVKLDVIEVDDGVVQQPPLQTQAGPPVAAALDIVVDMPKRVFVRGRGLDSEWAGRLAVQGTTAAPEVSGEVNLVRGQLDVVGKTFKLTEGTVSLPKAAEAEPALDVTAVYKGKELEVTAHMTGPLSQPELDLTSSPEVPRDEIVSRVLFNKSAANLTAGEAAQLAIALRSLTGGSGGDIMGFARRALGVDVLRFETGEEGGAAVEAGKYVTDEVYLGVKQGATTQSSGAQVEVEITPNITIESEVTGSGANKSGLKFQLDY